MLQGELNGVEFNGVAGRRGEPKPCPEDGMVSGIAADVLLTRNHATRGALAGPASKLRSRALAGPAREAAQQPSPSNALRTRARTQTHAHTRAHSQISFITIGRKAGSLRRG